MIYTNLTKKAMRIAYEAHHGQTDRSGVPYIYHPIHLAEQMDDEITTCIALLHDVLEDTSWTIEQLEAEFPPSITEAVMRLTHSPAEPYEDYVRRAAADPITRKIKLVDLDHNCDTSRIQGSDIPEETLARWKTKYAGARKILMQETNS